MECKLLKGSGPLMAMLMVQLISTGLQILSRVILTEGTFIFALLAYRHLLAAVCIAPFAFYFERGNGTKLTIKVGVWVFLCSLSRIIMGMGMFYYGLRDTSATYASNFLNLIPIVTFVFSIITRVEKLKWKTTKGKVKVVGATLCLGGAVIISLYKGIMLVHGSNYVHHRPTLTITRYTKPNWTRGTFILVASIISYAAWFILQVKLLQSYPFKYRATMLTCLSASIQAFVIGLCLNRQKTAWKLGWNLQLITIIYSAILASGLSFCLISWVISKRGPTFPAMLNPLSLVFVAILENVLLGQDLRIGSLLGMLVLIIGLYLFLWASNNKKTELPLPKSITGEGKVAKSNETGGLQLTATIVPTAPPVSHVSDEQ